MVGARGLEPPAPWSQTKYSNHTELRPDLQLIRSSMNQLVRRNYSQKEIHCQGFGVTFLNEPSFMFR